MRAIPLSSVAEWYQHGNVWMPRAVDTPCPKCGRFSTLVFHHTSHDANTQFGQGVARCARCGQQASLLIVDPSRDSQAPACKELFIHPSALGHRETILADVKVDERLERAYKAALDSFNAGIWSAALTACRRTLEGLVKLQLPEEKRKGMLAQQLKNLPEHADLTKPLLQLADALKDGGNIGAHFDLDVEPDAETATLMLDLIDYLLEYLYVIPKHAETLKARIDGMK